MPWFGALDLLSTGITYGICLPGTLYTKELWKQPMFSMASPWRNRASSKKY
ncbi:hypothetical protein HMPREF0322_02925 [Desulfitobacterium hafniense DP7]|uniref:Uncharacterized protein n=1 Tax=Desulfitobacterium hafniense DP7 TaxID=537010 RepID=G9XPM9_DESHA|nr:hypothetical protein HMPREF0322_02925 [Desulfitobacterium hafniense DP7]